MFSILSGLIAVPAITGTTEAIRQGQRQNAREEHRGRRSHLVVNTPVKSVYTPKFDGSLVILKDNKLYVDTAANQLGASHAGHPFTGYYLPHPENQSKWKGAGWKGEGMVSTISDDPPYLNWIYVDRFTNEIKYGNKEEAAGHLFGPWDCTETDKRVTFENWEGFWAVQEDISKDMWALYFDRESDYLTTREDMVGHKQLRKLQVSLSRREKPKTKEDMEADKEQRAELQRKRQEQESRRAEEKKLPLQEVFRKNSDGAAGGGKDFEVRIKHEEEVDD